MEKPKQFNDMHATIPSEHTLTDLLQAVVPFLMLYLN